MVPTIGTIILTSDVYVRGTLLWLFLESCTDVKWISLPLGLGAETWIKPYAENSWQKRIDQVFVDEEMWIGTMPI